jgi:O-acetyl-ADP-ribose deacetylase (regulator of RNase III)
MIETKNGNILYCVTDSFVNTVNEKGVMGKGLALQVKEKYPEVFKIYETACKKHLVSVGKILPIKANDGKLVINFPTKKHWKYPSQYIWIRQGLIDLSSFLEQNKISISIPKLGCANGGLDWKRIKNYIYEELDHLDNEIHIYE